jgi:Transposase IS66 family
LERQLGIPLQAATQWEIVEEAAEWIKPARDELIRQAAQGEVLHNDDTSMKVLKLERAPGDERTGVFTSGIVSTAQGWKIALYFTGRQHAGENIADVLRRRNRELGPAIQMCDALSWNAPKLPAGVELLIAHCLAHGRRLGKAITYLLRHWQPLTLFLRQAGAPLDNNICERALKRAVLHRKNALFYRTLNGAQVGDLFMSLIHTCQLCGASSFDYLTELQRHARELAACPAEWMPWNYRDTLGHI